MMGRGFNTLHVCWVQYELLLLFSWRLKISFLSKRSRQGKVLNRRQPYEITDTCNRSKNYFHKVNSFRNIKNRWLPSMFLSLLNLSLINYLNPLWTFCTCMCVVQALGLATTLVKMHHCWFLVCLILLDQNRVLYLTTLYLIMTPYKFSINLMVLSIRHCGMLSVSM